MTDHILFIFRAGKAFMVSFSVPDSQFPVPIKVTTDGDFLILINQQSTCDFGQDVVFCSQPTDMDLHLIKNVKCPVNKFEADNKSYADCIKYKITTGIIPNTVMTYHKLFTFPTGKAFASGKVTRCEMWVERLADEWIATSSKNLAHWLADPLASILIF